jgi:hypothetical protein
MQSKKSSASWIGLAVFTLFSSACVAACSFGDTDDDDDDIPLAGAAGKGGSAGAGTGGTAGKGGSAGASTGGTAGAAGTGGSAGSGGSAGAAPTGVTCDPTTGTKLTACEPDPSSTGDDLKCETCRKANCCEEWKTCGSSSPDNACGFGGPQNDGELNCLRRCILTARADGDVTTAEEGACGITCKSTGTNCATAISDDTTDIYSCLRGKCADDCFGGPFSG